MTSSKTNWSYQICWRLKFFSIGYFKKIRDFIWFKCMFLKYTNLMEILNAKNPCKSGLIIYIYFVWAVNTYFFQQRSAYYSLVHFWRSCDPSVWPDFKWKLKNGKLSAKIYNLQCNGYEEPIKYVILCKQT